MEPLFLINDKAVKEYTLIITQAKASAAKFAKKYGPICMYSFDALVSQLNTLQDDTLTDEEKTTKREAIEKKFYDAIDAHIKWAEKNGVTFN